MEEFKRLYLADTTRLEYRDSKGKGAIHFAAAKNHVNIIKYIKDHRGGNEQVINEGRRDALFTLQTWISRIMRATRLFITLSKTTPSMHSPVS